MISLHQIPVKPARLGLKKRLALASTRKAARRVGIDLADLVAPTVTNPLTNPKYAIELAAAAIDGVRLQDRMPDVPAEIVAVVEGDLKSAFWGRLETLLKRIKA